MSGTPVVKNIRVHPFAIIVHPQQKLALAIDDFYFDLMCLCVMERISQCLDGNPVNFVAEDRIEGSGRALYAHMDSGRLLAGLGGREFFGKSIDGRRQLAGSFR